MNIAKVYDANVYVNNASKHGLASEITAPTITALMTDYKAMGMIGSAEFFNGFDKLETTIKWTYPDNEAQKAFGNFLKPVDLMIRSSKAEYDNTGITEEKPIVMYIRGYSKTLPGGAFKAKEDTELESTVSVQYLALVIQSHRRGVSRRGARQGVSRFRLFRYRRQGRENRHADQSLPLRQTVWVRGV